MGFISKLKKEIDVLTGDASKDKIYSSEKTFPDMQSAGEAFLQAKQKLFDVNRWSDLPGMNSTFELYDGKGIRAAHRNVQKGDYIRIILPAPTPENWVHVERVQEGENMADFLVCPSPDPKDNKDEVEHFFVEEATSTFRVVIKGTVLKAYEIGRNEAINQEDTSGGRAILNTLIAEGGWAGFQEFQWEKLTDYLVHKINIENNNQGIK